MRLLARAVERSDVAAAEFLIAGSSLQFLTADAAGTLRVYGGYEQQSTVMHPLCDPADAQLPPLTRRSELLQHVSTS